MKSYRKYIAFTAGSLALLWMYGHGLKPIVNPINGDLVVDSTVLKKPLWRKFFERKDVILGLAWLFAGPGATSMGLPGDFNTNVNTVYCIGCGSDGEPGGQSGDGVPGVGGGAGAFVGSGTAIGGAPYNRLGPNTVVGIQIGTNGSSNATIFDTSSPFIYCVGSYGSQSGGQAGNCGGPSGCLIYSGGDGGPAGVATPNGGGGAGAAGPHGAGQTGASGDSGGAGGNGDNFNVGPGGNSQFFDGLYGPGGGGQGGVGSFVSGGNGGFAGAGGGGGGANSAFGGTPWVVPGSATGGLIAVSYDPNIFIFQGLSGTGALAASATAQLQITSTEAGAGHLTAVVTDVGPAAAQLNGAGNVSLDIRFLGKWPGSGTLAGNGGLTLNALATKFGATNFSGAGQFNPPAALWAVSAASFGGGGDLDVIGLVNPPLLYPPLSPKWSPHSADDYVQGFNSLLPPGAAWPREPGHVLQLVVTGLMQIWGQNVDTDAALLLTQESDPRQTTILLPDWERNFGLPDPCLTPPSTVAARRAALVSRMTFLGGQSKQFFINLAADLGYDIDIEEFSPFMAGVSMCGDTTAQNVADGGDSTFPRWQIGDPIMRFYWTVSVNNVALTWFRASSGQAGVDPHLRIGVPTDLECIFKRYAPAHTQVVFNFSGIDRDNPLAGTP